ncbi:MAG: PA2779 family protein [Nitrospinota bacterium]|nr:PA2779 family protein [Nitrospinota bacterium]
MRIKKAIRFCGVYLLAAIMLWVPTVAQAEMLSTQKTLQSLSSNAEKREWLSSMVLRKEVQEQLQEHGVSRAESMNRVNSMTDDEVASVINQIEQYVAAGDPLWRASGDKDAGYIFAIVVGVIILGCLAFCWIIFI